MGAQLLDRLQDEADKHTNSIRCVRAPTAIASVANTSTQRLLLNRAAGRRAALRACGRPPGRLPSA